MQRVEPLKILFICTGNICRSPLAEGLAGDLMRRSGVADRVIVDSAGTHAWIGEPPDPRACAVAANHGIDIQRLRGREVTKDDFRIFDWILAMDHENHRWLSAFGGSDSRQNLHSFLEFTGGTDRMEVPDPYGGGQAEFERVYEIIETGVRGLSRVLRDEWFK